MSFLLAGLIAPDAAAGRLGPPATVVPLRHGYAIRLLEPHLLNGEPLPAAVLAAAEAVSAGARVVLVVTQALDWLGVGFRALGLDERRDWRLGG